VAIPYTPAKKNASTYRFRVLIARTLSTAALPVIPGRPWKADKFSSGIAAWSCFAKDHEDAKLILDLCQAANRRAWIYPGL
jgi:hypothetical protein